MQRSVQFKNNRTRGVLRHERYVCTRAQCMFVGTQLDLNPVVGYIVARSRNGLGLRARRYSEETQNNCQRGDLRSQITDIRQTIGEKTWSRHSDDRFDDRHYSSTHHSPASAGRLGNLGRRVGWPEQLCGCRRVGKRPGRSSFRQGRPNQPGVRKAVVQKSVRETSRSVLPGAARPQF